LQSLCSELSPSDPHSRVGVIDPRELRELLSDRSATAANLLPDVTSRGDLLPGGSLAMKSDVLLDHELMRRSLESSAPVTAVA